MAGADIKEHIGKFTGISEKEMEAIDGKSGKTWFISLAEAKDYDALLEMFDPSKHDGDWSKEDGKFQQGEGSIVDRWTHQRGVCYFAAARRDIRQHYMEGEVSSCIREKAVRRAWEAGEANFSMYFIVPSDQGGDG